MQAPGIPEDWYGTYTRVLSVTPDSYIFEDTYIGQTTSANFTFSNTGSDPVNITDITFTDLLSVSITLLSYTSWTKRRYRYIYTCKRLL
ncbi:MAG: hypothetical protein R2764_13040 [Bacteroidales bacterium]